MALAVGVLGAFFGVAGEARAQEECELVRSRWFQSISVGGGHSIIFFSGPVTFRCRGGVVLRADSAEHFQAQNETHMLGRVSYTDSLKTLTADRANYLRGEQRIVAWGNVVVRDHREGSVVTGDTVRYLRPVRGRAEEQMTVTGRRPRGTLYVRRDTTAQGGSGRAVQVGGRREPVARADTVASPYEVEADRLVLAGDRYFEATGRVVITRDALRAYAERAEYDRPSERLTLMQAARVEGEDYELFGETVVLRLPEGDVREVTATGDALLTGERLRLSAPRIRIELADGELQRLYAVLSPGERRAALPGPVRAGEPGERLLGKADSAMSAGPQRPEATTEDFLLRADSIEVAAPSQRLEQVMAVGAAHGEALKSDTVLGSDAPPLIRRDWLEGDTILAYFTARDSTGSGAPHAVGAERAAVLERGAASTAIAVVDTTGAPGSRPLPLRKLVATGAAAGADSLAALDTAGPPGPELRGSDSKRESVPPDTVRPEVRLERMIARGNARSLYRIVSADTAATGGRRVAVHYVTGSEITVVMNEEGEVREVSVRGPTRGVHLEPVRTREQRPPPVSGAAGEGNAERWESVAARRPGGHVHTGSGLAAAAPSARAPRGGGRP